MDEIPIFIAILSFIVMCIGEILAYYSISLKYRYEFEAISFGFIFGVATLILIPKSFFEGFEIFVVFGMIVVYLIEKYLAYCPLSRKYCIECDNLEEVIKIKFIYPISFFIHTFIDGLIIAVSYISNIGLPLYFAILLHKLPAGFVLMSPLKGVYKNPLYPGVIVSFGTVLGTVIGLITLKNISPKILLAFSGGIFLGAFLMLVPHIYEHKKEKSFLYLLIGYILVMVITLIQ
ncbi:ZIP family metal transporter [Methanocaldococcus fervens]|uniref:Zinc/iron permease n=1 Tax=Methanocaldococcus fervens (strain DSM 4213 / JCM 15782 / AG86) TaxID=573064 RepID=C7P935_METFA|nr:ZIP family metal transporter [Methanocaldococcus fervens]ACV25067.1 zinc/iron permease [Methanocaldococcus fervens AG86]